MLRHTCLCDGSGSTGLLGTNLSSGMASLLCSKQQQQQQQHVDAVAA
jgi:hypothetical protein